MNISSQLHNRVEIQIDNALRLSAGMEALRTATTRTKAHGTKTLQNPIHPRSLSQC